MAWKEAQKQELSRVEAEEFERVQRAKREADEAERQQVGHPAGARAPSGAGRGGASLHSYMLPCPLKPAGSGAHASHAK